MKVQKRLTFARNPFHYCCSYDAEEALLLLMITMSLLEDVAVVDFECCCGEEEEAQLYHLPSTTC